MNILASQKGEQFGSYFGAAILNARITDVDTVLIVGAPTYSAKYADEGRIFIYAFENVSICYFNYKVIIHVYEHILE